MITKLLLAGLVVILGAHGAAEYLVPPIAAHLYREEYHAKMFQCDHVMREHFIAKKAVQFAPSEVTIRNLGATEVGLMSCQDYDKLRKWLQTLGVSEAKLGLMGVEALEARSKDVRRFVEIHEIRY